MRIENNHVPHDCFKAPSTFSQAFPTAEQVQKALAILLSVSLLVPGVPISTPLGSLSAAEEDATPPPVPLPIAPVDSTTIPEDTPTFRWVKVADPSGIEYILQIDNDPDFSSPKLVKESLIDNAYTLLPSEALVGGRWFWRVKAIDGAGNESAWSDVWTFLIDLYGPQAVQLIPDNSTSVSDNTPMIAARLIDDGTGIRDNMQLFINGTQLTPVFFSPDNGWFWYENENRELAETLHQVELRVWDNFGHFSVIIWQFRVDRTRPTRPVLLSPPSPADGEVIGNPTPTFDWSDSVDASSMVYILQLDSSSDFSSPENFSTPQSQYTLPSPLSDGLYYWRVRVRDNAGNENFSDTWNFILDTIPSEAPTGISPEDGLTLADNTPVFKWYTVLGASRYHLQVDNDPDFGSPIYDNSQLTENIDNFDLHPENSLPDGVWYWRVSSLDPVGNAEWSPTYVFHVDTSPPAEAPTLLSPPDNYFTNLRRPVFRWTAVSDPSGVTYTLEISNDASFSLNVQTIEGISDNQYSLPSALEDNTYFWRVRAVDSLGHMGPFSSSRSFTVDTHVDKPSLLAPANGSILSDPRVEFTWTPVTEELGAVFTLEISAFSDFRTLARKISGLKTSNYTLLDELSEGTWYWRVRVNDQVYDENGVQTGNENLSDVFFFVIDRLVAAPVPEAPANGALVREWVTLDWSDVTDQVGPVRYYIFVDNDSWDPNGYVDVWVGPTIWRVMMGGYPSPEVVENSGDWTISQMTIWGLFQGTYHWRVLVADGVPNFTWSREGTFIVDLTPPYTPAFVAYDPTFPPYDKVINDPTPWFCWEASAGDPYPYLGSPITYNLLIDNDPDFSSPKYVISDIPDSKTTFYQQWACGGWSSIPIERDNIINYRLENFLTDGKWYWKVQAVDQAGNAENIPGSHYFVIDTQPLTSPPVLNLPVDGENLNYDTPTLSWDSLSGAHGYEVHYALNKDFTENLNIALTTSTSYTLSPTPDGTWHWRVRARDDAWNWGPWSLVRIFRIDTAVEAPQLISPDNQWIINDNTPMLRWSRVEDPFGVSYRVQIDNDLDFSSPAYDLSWISENSHIVENQLASGRWYWRVAAIDGLNNTSWSENRLFWVDTSAPEVPVPLAPENSSYTNDTTPSFSWLPSFDISSVTYEFQLDNDNDFTNGMIYQISGLTENFLVLPPENSLSDGNYRWRVRGLDSWGYVGGWSEIFQFTVDTEAPTQAPSLISPASGTNTRDNLPTFTWSSVADATKYEIWIDSSSAFDNSEGRLLVENSSTTSFTPSDHLLDGVYYWRVRAIDAAGNFGESWSDIWWLKIDSSVEAPLLISPEDNHCTNDNRPGFSWTAISDASPPVRYRLQISLNSDFTQVVYDNASIYTNELEIENELSENVYCWRVWSIDNLGNYSLSSWREFTVDQTPPSSSVDTILPYWQRTPEFTISATASDTLSGVDRVELYYRYSEDNMFWSSWTWIFTDPDPPWSFSFYSPHGEGYYEFFSRAVDQAGNSENLKNLAEQRCGVDTHVDPPELNLPKNLERLTDNTPHFDWFSVPEVSGVRYSLEIDNTPNFLPPLLRVENLEDSEYTIPPENSLTFGEYFWRVKAVDLAGNENWSSVWSFWISTWRALEGWSGMVMAWASWNSLEEWSSSIDAPAWWGAIELWTGEITTPNTFVDNLDLDFSQGAHENTENVENSVRLVTGETQGKFTSRIFDAGWYVRWNTLVWMENEPEAFLQENDNVGSEPDPLIDGTARSGVVLDGSIENLRSVDGSYENIGENSEDNTLNWCHVIENISAGFDSYTVIIRGFTSGDAENVGVYIWENQGVAWGWRFLDNLTDSVKTITFTITGENWENYVIGENIHLRYLENTADTIQTVVHLDVVLLQENVHYHTTIRLQVRVSADNIQWSENLGPDGTPGSYFEESPTSLGNIPENRYFQYVVYLWTENAQVLGGENGPSILEVTVEFEPFLGSPTLVSPDNTETIRDNTPIFTWVRGLNALYHRLLVDNDLDFSSPRENVLLEGTENSFEIPVERALADGTYYWKVIAIAGDGTEASSEVYMFNLSTGIEIPLLLSPENTKHLNDNTPLFRWCTAENADNYRLEVTNLLDFHLVYENITENFYELPVQLSEGRWFWRVRGFDNWGNVGGWSETWEFRIDITPPAPILLQRPADGSETNDNTPLFRWFGGADEFFSAYRLIIDNDPNLSSPRYDNSNITQNSIELPAENALDLSGIWYWRVRSIDLAGNYRWSELWSFVYDNVQPDTPTTQFPENNTFTNDNAPTFQWTNVTGEAGYRLVIDNDPNFADGENTYDNARIPADTTAVKIENELPDGIWYWRVCAFDRAGNRSEWSERYKLTVDTSAPKTPALIAPSNGSLSNSAVIIFRWTKVLDDWAPGFENYIIQIARDDGFANVYHENSVEENVYLYTFTEDNIFYWRVRAIDNAGNQSPWSEAWRIGIDTIAPPPPVLVSPDNDESLNTKTPFFNWNPVQDSSGVTYCLQIDNDNDFSSTEYESSGIVQSQHALQDPLPEGAWYWRVQAVDLAGNLSSWSEMRIFRVDLHVLPPTLLTPAPGTTLRDQTPFFEWIAPETFVTYTLVIDNDQNFSSPVYENTTLTENFDNFDQHPENALPDGLYYWCVRAVDRAGNENVSVAGWFKIDTIVSSPVLLSPENERAINDNTPRFDWQAVPDVSGVSYSLKIMRADTTVVIWENSILISEFTVSTELTDGSYKWCVGVIDGAGNENWSENWSFEIDTVAPVASPSLLSPGAFVNTGCPTFKWSSVLDSDNYLLQIATDPAFDSVVRSLFDIRANEYSLSQQEELEDGTYYWRVAAGDNAGNLGPWSDNWKLTVDTVAPSTPSLESPALGSYENDNTPVFTWSAVSDPSGIAYCLQIATDNNFANVVYSSHPPENVDNFDLHPENALSDSGYYWRVMATDNAGNSSTSQTWWFLVDTVAPGKPTGLTPSGILKDNPSPIFDWLGVSDLSGVMYHLQVATDNLFSNVVLDKAGFLSSRYRPSELPENLYCWRVRAIDRAGNQGAWSEYVQLVLDYRGPVPQDNSLWLWIHQRTENEENRQLLPSDGTFVNDNTPTLWFVLEDYGAGISDNFTVEIDRSINFSSPASLTLIKSYLENREGNYLVIRAENTMGALADGQWYLRLRAWDNIPQAYGDSHFTEQVYYFVVDVTAPPEAPSWLENSWHNDNTPTFSWTEIVDDTGEKVIRYQLRITRGSSIDENIVYDNAWVYDEYVGDEKVVHTIPDENALPESENYYRWVRGIDKAGNPGPWSSGRWFGIDITAPVSLVNAPTQNQSSAPFSVSASASDELSGVENVELWYRYSSDGSNWEDWWSFGVDNDGADGWSWNFSAPDGRGYYQFYSIATDRAGNKSAAPKTADLQVKYGYSVSVSVSPSGAGSASASPTIALVGETVTLTQSASYGYFFSHWSTSPPVSISNNQFSMPASDVSITAHFSTLPTYTLTIFVNPENGGTTTPTAGEHTYAQGTIVNITASAKTGYQFKNWSGDASGTSPTTSVTMNTNKSVTANFELVSYTITISKTPEDGGEVSVSPGLTLHYGTSVTVTATPASGYKFVRWEGEFTDNTNPKTFSMPAENISLVAKFERVEENGLPEPTYLVTIEVKPSGAGTVMISPSDRVRAGTQVTITAEAASGYKFTGWSGDYTSMENPFTFTMPAKDVWIIANFEKPGAVELPVAWIGAGLAVVMGVFVFFRLKGRGIPGLPKEEW